MPKFSLRVGDCLAVLKTIPDNSIDAIVTDPPYGLEFMGKDWDAPWKASTSDTDGFRRAANESDIGRESVFGRVSKRSPEYKAGIGFQRWCEQWAIEALRVLKPGGYILAFGGTRTYHRLACAIEDAGFEIRDSLDWLYGTGFPKSLNIAKQFEDAELAAQWEGWGTALKPGHEPIVMARKPLDGTVANNIQRWGTGGLNIDACRIENGPRPLREHVPQSDAVQGNTFAPTTSAMAVGETETGRWPANVLLDEEAAEMLDQQSGTRKSGGGDKGNKTIGVQGYGSNSRTYSTKEYKPNEGGASRFFYVAKASRSERELGCEALPQKTAGEATGGRKEGSDGLNSPRAGAGRTNGARNFHPTVKPIALMCHLVRLVTPPGGVVLDPFVGSGTTGMAALQEGFDFIGIEKEPDYLPIAEARLNYASVNQ